MTKRLLRGGSIVSEGHVLLADVLIEDGVVHAVGADLAVDGAEIVECAGMLLFPGFIDMHVHFREPGFPLKATMASEAAAARAGGVLTVCEMPNTNPPTVTRVAFEDKVRRAAALPIDVRFYMGTTQREHLDEIRSVAHDPALRARCSGVKVYFDHSTGNQGVDSAILDDIFALCGELDLLAVGHCEDPATNAAAKAHVTRTDVAAHSLMRPPEAEAIAVERALDLARRHNTRFHVAHLSTAPGLAAVQQAKQDGLPVTCEVAPHHLFFTLEDYAARSTAIKVNPPIRSRMHVEALWDGIRDGTVDCIATDHAPHTREEKAHPDPLSAPSGMPAVEVVVPLLLDAVARGERGLTYPDVVRLLHANPNRIVRLGKQGVAEGSSDGIVLVDPAREWIVQGNELHSLCGWSPYEGMRLRGAVKAVC